MSCSSESMHYNEKMNGLTVGYLGPCSTHDNLRADYVLKCITRLHISKNKLF